MAIPLAAGFCFIVTVLIMATVITRTGVKRQNRASFQAMKAHFMAQGAIQMALLKFRVLPNEGFYASDEAKNGNLGPLDTFIRNLDTGTIGLAVSPPSGTWVASVVEGKALNAVNEGSDYDDWVHVVRLRATAEVSTGFLNGDGSAENRVEEVTKVIEVRKER
jgi:hypothetical protein